MLVWKYVFCLVCILLVIVFYLFNVNKVGRLVILLLFFYFLGIDREDIFWIGYMIKKVL